MINLQVVALLRIEQKDKSYNYLNDYQIYDS